MSSRTAAARPEIDWTVDSELPSHFKEWQRHVSNEIRLLMAEDPNKKEEWACTFAIVCFGEQGVNILQQAGKLGEKIDFTVPYCTSF